MVSLYDQWVISSFVDWLVIHDLFAKFANLVLMLSIQINNQCSRSTVLNRVNHGVYHQLLHLINKETG